MEPSTKLPSTNTWVRLQDVDRDNKDRVLKLLGDLAQKQPIHIKISLDENTQNKLDQARLVLQQYKEQLLENKVKVHEQDIQLEEFRDYHDRMIRVAEKSKLQSNYFLKTREQICEAIANFRKQTNKSLKQIHDHLKTLKKKVVVEGCHSDKRYQVQPFQMYDNYLRRKQIFINRIEQQFSSLQVKLKILYLQDQKMQLEFENRQNAEQRVNLFFNPLQIQGNAEKLGRFSHTRKKKTLQEMGFGEKQPLDPKSRNLSKRKKNLEFI